MSRPTRIDIQRKSRIQKQQDIRNENTYPAALVCPLAVLPFVSVSVRLFHLLPLLKTSKALLKSYAHQGTSLFTSAATNQRGFQRGPRGAQVRFPEHQQVTQ